MAKPLSLRCRDAEHPDGGYATITATGFSAGGEDGTMIVRRFDRPEQFLGRHGWQVAEATIKPREFRVGSGQATIEIGPEMVDYMETGLSVEVQFPASGQSGTMVWPDVAPSILRGSHGHQVAGRQVVAGDPLSRQLRAARPVPSEPAAPPPQPAPPPAPPPAPSRANVGNDAKTVVIKSSQAPQGPRLDAPTIRPSQAHSQSPAQPSRVAVSDKASSGGSGGLIAVIVGVALAALLAGGAWVYLNCPDWAPYCAITPTPGPIAGPAPGPGIKAEPVVSCPAAKLVREAAAMPLDEVYRGAIACQQKGEWSAAIGALQIAISRGHGRSAAALAMLYDPATFKPGGYVAQADPYEAARFYRLAVDLGDASAAPAREALRQKLVQEASQGSIAARLALQNYW